MRNISLLKEKNGINSLHLLLDIKVNIELSVKAIALLNEVSKVNGNLYIIILIIIISILSK
jgi:hypothetical protein